jgi:hypothetical protein
MSIEKVPKFKKSREAPRLIRAWDRAVPEIAQARFMQFLPSSLLKTPDIPQVVAATDAIVAAIVAAVDQAVPSKLAKMGGHGNKASPALKSAIQVSKSVFWKWKQGGRPPPDHPLSLARKEAKRNLCGTMRCEEAERRQKLYSDLMNSPNDKAFYKLINRHRGSAVSGGAILVAGQPISDPQDQCHAWAKYFGQLATPTSESHFDEAYRELVESDTELIDILSSTHELWEPFTVDEVSSAINGLNSGKAADEDGLCAESLRMITSQLAPVLCELFNHMMLLGYVPPSLKRGILTPIGKKGKSCLLQDNYRGITVTVALGKVLEHLLKACIKPQQLRSQSKLQFGFTEKVSPSMAALIVSESIAEAEDNGSCLYVCTLDAKKAFDTVCHASLLRKLFVDGVDLKCWKLTQQCYKGMTSKVKWKDNMSEEFKIYQGVPQSGVLSPDLYKIYINDLIKSVEDSN